MSCTVRMMTSARVASLGNVTRPSHNPAMLRMMSSAVIGPSVRSAAFSRVKRVASPKAVFNTRATLSGDSHGLSDGCKGAPVAPGQKLPIVGTEAIMSQKAHGSTEKAVQENLRYGCDQKTADKICSYNRHYAEYGGYWKKTTFLAEVDRAAETTFYDSVTGLPLFVAPRGRSFEEFEKESNSHGWPSFRDEEVVWANVRTLSDGECVSLAGTHLGHNLPDTDGNRYCINLVSVAGNPVC